MKKRELNLIRAEEEIALIEDMGHSVKRFNDIHWRIYDKIDVWPSSRRFWVVGSSGKAKRYENLTDIFK